jgi:hypothetical protein
MARRPRDVPKEDIYEEVHSEHADAYSNSSIPEGCTHYKLEVDYSGCYYEGDQPSYIIHWYKKK